MSYFWLIAIVLTGVALVLLLRPFIRRREAIEALFDGKTDFTVYRDQLDRLERDLEAGTLSAETAETMRAEIGHRLLAAEAAAPKAHFYFDPLRTAGIIVLTLTIGAVIVYALHGAPLLPSQPFNSQSAAADPRGEVTRLAEKLAKKVEAAPDDLETWIRLGLAYRFLRRYREAADAYSVAVGLTGTGRTDLLAAYGENLVLAENGTVTPEAKRAFASVLDYDPSDPSARYYLGLAEFQDKAFPAALGRWKSLLKDLPATHPLLVPLGEQIQWVEEKMQEDAAAEEPGS